MDIVIEWKPFAIGDAPAQAPTYPPSDFIWTQTDKAGQATIWRYDGQLSRWELLAVSAGFEPTEPFGPTV
jgi:hypothetical protein